MHWITNLEMIPSQKSTMNAATGLYWRVL